MINPTAYGISFSIKQCRNFGLDPRATLQWLLDQGWRRFRLMSYWNEHEKTQGQYDFSELDWQLLAIAKAGGSVSLCLGVKQPRWPEYHWPQWAWQLPKPERDTALLAYVEQTVDRYKRWSVIASYQLEHEALLKGFGEKIDISRTRLRQELAAVRRLDPTRPIIITTSNGWGIPLRRPLPDYVGFSYYFRMFSHGRYHSSVQSHWLHRVRRSCIRILLGKQVFIHELQCEPWGPAAIWKMTSEEQAKSMSPQQIVHNIQTAKKVGAYPIDLWGAEWWYWRWLQGDTTIWNSVKDNI